MTNRMSQIAVITPSIIITTRAVVKTQKFHAIVAVCRSIAAIEPIKRRMFLADKFPCATPLADIPKIIKAGDVRLYFRFQRLTNKSH